MRAHSATGEPTPFVDCLDDDEDEENGQDESFTRTEDSLPDILMGFAVRSKFEDHEPTFYPVHCVNQLLTKGAIRKALRPQHGSSGNNYDKQFEKLVDFICSHARTLLAVALQCDFHPDSLEVVMKRFGKRKSLVMDRNLPIMELKLALDGRNVEIPPAFDINLWSKRKLKRFYDEQWGFLAPVFSNSKYWYELDKECIMPFIHKDSQQEDGGFSVVSKVHIHESHDPDKFNEVAIKQIKLNVGRSEEDIKARVEEEWGREAKSLERINGLGHPHIVKCHAAIRRGENRYFMFPWADGGSLREFWQATPEQKPKMSTIRQAIQQLRGLADALDRLHNLGSTEVENHEDPIPVGLQVPELRLQGERLEDQDHVESLHIRHGDIKPENILRFNVPQDNLDDLGTLKLADMGLAKQHIMATVERKNITSTRYGTIRYEAPEARTTLVEARSRLYDIWSIGCVTLEYIIWILYGYGALKTFYGHFDFQPSPFFNTTQGHDLSGSLRQTHVVHPVVEHWIRHIESTDPECKDVEASAIKDLLTLVKDRLLVIALNPRRGTARSGLSGLSGGRSAFSEPVEEGQARVFRANAEELRDALDCIISRLDEDDYVLTGKSRHKAIPPGERENRMGPGLSLAPPGAKKQQQGPASPPRQAQDMLGSADRRRKDYDLPPLKDWEFPVDNGFAQRVLGRIGAKNFVPSKSVPAKLCTRCQNIDFWCGNFTLVESRSKLQDTATFCQFCALLLEICQKFNTREQVRFDRKESTLRLSDIHAQPVLSMIRSPELQTPTRVNIQLGLPEPPQPGSAEFYELLNLWLQDCNEMHPGCKINKPIHPPTRLIEVGADRPPTLRLLETAVDDVRETRYIALSHPWGDGEKHPPFITTRKNMAQFMRGIDFCALPQTLRDAVLVTQGLGIRYLWADTLCIIQGDNGDFGTESERMEDVYSSAYCVVAASRASGTHDGFLHPLPRREYLTFQRGAEKPFYVCKPIDDFSGDVLQSSLAKRGWVFQERALARRTIFFAENQTYFECGGGVRCQTLSRMHNKLADFLGDPNFPVKGMNSGRGVKIRYFQDLYCQYSRLEFSRDSDRPYAIDGLEKRLRKAYGTSGGWGIFDDGPGNGLFHRSLLWCRGDELVAAGTSMEPIAFPAYLNVTAPSWSWMSYCGAVDYFDPPFKNTEWESQDIEPPWTRDGGGDAIQSGISGSAVGIRARVRHFNLGRAKATDFKIVYDQERNRRETGTKGECVVVARGFESKLSNMGGDETDKDVTDEQKRFYVLTVAQSPGQDKAEKNGRKVYHRTGAGYILGKYITLVGEGVKAKIC